jgi:hypothetical protein
MAINELSPKQIENAKPRDTDYKITDGGSLGNGANLLI